MAGYCTTSNIQEELNSDLLLQIADPLQSGSLDEDYIGTAISKAASVIDAYVGESIQLPLSEPYPPVLVSVNTDIAIYLLFIRSMTVPEVWQERYSDAMNFLSFCANHPEKIDLESTVASGAPVYFARTEDLVRDMLDVY
ncbi:hypothetical protein COS16_10930 [Candidatus Desantisbacteria bacterium CG02_land_8_20_14_3_00_49_13]|nr:MAG: hypothetical protein COS16_10930 [Candidatus Desantisbacteria bacterium CG02_land_8_20_14_3_00_49_13]